MSGREISYLAEKVFVHRWPHDTPEWDDATRQDIDRRINKNPEKKRITVTGRKVRVGEYEFYSLKKLGISVPFFKRDCRMIFEARFGSLYAHVHIITGTDDYVEVFGRLMSWKRTEFPDA